MLGLAIAGAMTVGAGCGGPAGDDLTAHTSFVVTSAQGSTPSPLDPLADQTIEIDVVWPTIQSNNGDGSDPAGCKTTALFAASTRTAHGSSAGVVQTEILDRLPDWDVRLQLCDASGQSSIALEAVINELNLSFGCFGVPASAMKRNGGGFPIMTSFTATQCSATILDVVNVKVLSNPDFSIVFTTGPDELP